MLPKVSITTIHSFLLPESSLLKSKLIDGRKIIIFNVTSIWFHFLRAHVFVYVVVGTLCRNARRLQYFLIASFNLMLLTPGAEKKIIVFLVACMIYICAAVICLSVVRCQISKLILEQLIHKIGIWSVNIRILFANRKKEIKRNDMVDMDIQRNCMCTKACASLHNKTHIMDE